MLNLIQSGLGGLIMGVSALTLENGVMILAGGMLLYLGIRKDYEPLLLVPIGFGAILVNMPLSGMMGEGGLFKQFYDFGVITEVFPCLIFVGIGAMTDFSPLLENPKILLLGAAGQFGIFLTLLLAIGLGFNLLDAVSIGIIGACDGPTSIYVTSKYAPHLLGAVSVAAYSYMALVPLIQPPIMKLLTTEREKRVKMPYPERSVSPNLKIIFPIAVTVITCLIAPMGTPLMGMLMLGNLMKESGVVNRLTKASENEIANVVTLLLGLSIGATMEGSAFLKPQTLLILGLGFLAICLDTVTGVLFGKLMCFLTNGKVNPLVGAAGISAYPMAARVVQTEGRRYDTNNWLLMHAMGANTGGQIGSIMAAAIMLSVLKGLGIG
ncbi:sodium ion-translocating decarboxylase subunit beta [Syntrophobacter fumaroxidans]|uniref:Sodium ion-translocating decarboxylase, beta subunit n=1 Tax=Syntrophobacter fumaroxidans (strain DSM 10017 / MPOB) TaxID=335543 RepID=A0LPA3_SYNFM|nr:sodium ion-translocating decarboxylase subunit beta [Syntrophobacter fumaroxidans]ABK19255.1 sodium ion-translocating decarboxylase, beta subunit [Syntrophobacter fumaroxidans MPOB]